MSDAEAYKRAHEGAAPMAAGPTGPLTGIRIIDFTRSLRPPEIALPAGFEWLYPYDNPETMRAMSTFYQKFYADNQVRTFIFGINPGRFGAGVTGVPFTDPVRLEKACGIENGFQKKPEFLIGVD